MKRTILVMAIAGTIIACKSKEKVVSPDDGEVKTTVVEKEKRTMPEGRLNRVTYSYQGMAMEPFRDFDLRRNADGTGCMLSFKIRLEEMSYEVSDTLLDAARRIIEEERMYEYATFYSFKSDARVLDGYHWDFDAYFEGGEKILSGGRHVSPKGDGLNKIRKLLYHAAEQCNQVTE